MLNALFTGHFLTTEQCSKVARSQGWIELLVPALLTQLTVGPGLIVKKLDVVPAKVCVHACVKERGRKRGSERKYMSLTLNLLTMEYGFVMIMYEPSIVYSVLGVVHTFFPHFESCKESNVKSDNQPTTARTQENKDAYVPVSAVGECKYKDNGGADGTQQGKNSKAEFEGKTKYYNYNSIFVSSTIMI